MELTMDFVSDLLIRAIDESDEAVQQFTAAQQNLTTAKTCRYEELQLENGRIVLKPISAIMAEILEDANVPDSVMPGGKATGGNADERKACRLSWVRKNNALYAEYQRQLDDADFQTQLASGSLASAKEYAKASRAKLNAVAAFSKALKENMRNETERLKIAQVKASTDAYEETERGRQYDESPVVKWAQEPEEKSQILRRHQDVHDGLF